MNVHINILLKNENIIYGTFHFRSSDEWISMDSSRLRAIQQYKKAPISFVVGEQCLARWSDARKFPATVQKVLERDMYEVLFDDGFTKTVKANHMGKVRTQLNPGSPGNTNKPPPVNLPSLVKSDSIDWSSKYNQKFKF